MELCIDGRVVRYIDEGSGPAVLLLHGWASPAQNYRLIIDHLSPRCRVIAPDMPGFGGSEEPDNPWTSAEFVDFFLKFIKAVNIQDPILIGHSHGGRIILNLLNHPNWPFDTKKIILIDATGIKPKHSLKYYVKIYTYKLAKRLFPARAERMRRRVGSADYNNASPIMRQTMVKLLAEDVTPLLARIRASALLIWGDMDTATPLAAGRVMEQRIPDAGLVVLKGTGHFSFAEAWGQCSRVLDAFIF